MDFLGCFLMHVFAAAGTKSFGVLYADLLDEYQSSAGTTGWIPGIAMFLIMGLGPVSTYISSLYSYRLVVMLGGFLMMLGCVSSAFVTRMEVMYFTYGIISGIGYGLSYAPCVVMVSFYWEERRALANGVAVSGNGIGSFALPFLLRYLIDTYTIYGALMLFGGLLFQVSIAGSLLNYPYHVFRKEKNPSLLEDAKLNENIYESQRRSLLALDDDLHKEVIRNTSSFQEQPSHTPKTTCQMLCSDWFTCSCYCKCLGDKEPTDNNRFKPKFDWALLKDYRFGLLAGGFVVANLGYAPNFFVIPAHAEFINLPKSDGALLLAIIGIGDLAGRLLFGWFADLKIISSVSCVTLSCVISGVGAMIISFPFAWTRTALIVYCLILGVFTGSMWALIPVCLSETLGISRLSSSFGLTVFFIAFAILLGTPIAGWIKDAQGDWSMSFRFISIAFLLATVILIILGVVLRRSRLASKTTT